jgi:hypothetical protein
MLDMYHVLYGRYEGSANLNEDVRMSNLHRQEAMTSEAPL